MKFDSDSYLSDHHSDACLAHPSEQPVAAANAVSTGTSQRPLGAILNQLESVSDRQSFLRGVPLHFGQRFAGFMGLAFKRPFTLDDADTERVMALAHEAALAVELLRIVEAEHTAALAAERAHMLREREATERQRTEALLSAHNALWRSTAKLVTSDSLPQFLDVLLHEAVLSAGAVSGMVFVTTPSGDKLHSVSMVQYGEIIDIARNPVASTWRQPIPIRSVPFWETLAQRREEIWLDYTNPQAADFDTVTDWHRAAWHGFMCVLPMIDSSRLIGLLALAYDKSNLVRPNTQRLEFCHVLAQQATLAVRMTNLSTESRRTAVLEERTRLAREIHDAITQSFIGIRMQLLACQGEFSDQRINEALKLAEQGLNDARQAVQALRPWHLQTKSFEDAIGELAVNTLGDKVQLKLIRTSSWQSMAEEIEGQLFRILQETLNNIAKHAKAKEVRIELSIASSERSILVADDGIGFDIEASVRERGFGLFSIRQRAENIGARLELASELGRGTQVLISLATTASAT